MNVLVFAPYPSDCSPGQRFRFEQWINLLSVPGVTFDMHPLFSRRAYSRFYSPGHHTRKVAYTLAGLTRRSIELRTLRRADVVLLYREMFPLGPPLLEALLQSRTPFVYDFDDAIFLRATNPHNRAASILKRPDKVGSIIAAAAHTTVGNDYLAQYARRFSSQVSVLPTTLDTVKYDRPAGWRRAPGPLRLGWTGSTTTTAYLHTIDGALRRILSKQQVELVVVGSASYTLPGVANTSSKPWRLATEVADVLEFDIGLMPLTDDEFALGKCGFKALLYMALGVPCVVSPVGVNASIVQHGVNGLLASTEEEWVDAVSNLINDESLRRRLATAGRETVVSGYDGRSVAPKFLSILEKAAAAGARPAGI